MSPAKQIGLIVLAGILAVGGYEGWQRYNATAATEAAPTPQRAERKVRVAVAPAAYRDIKTTVEAVGTSRARRTVTITPFAAGQVMEVAFSSGQQVSAGDVLIRLDQEIQRADLIEAEARLTEANSALARAQTLKKSNTVTIATVDNLVAEVAIARAERERAARRLRDRVITAPFPGVVGFTDVELGAQLEIGDVIAVLDDLSEVEIEFTLPEGLFGQVQAGQKVFASTAAFPGKTFDAVITSIDSRIATVSRAFKARAVIPNQDGALPAGMFMHLDVVLAAQRALTVPEEAVVVDGSDAFVFAVIQEDGVARTERRSITTGRRSFGYVEILDGVAEGDDVIIRGVQKVRDGSLIDAQRLVADDAAPDKEAGS